MKKPRNLSNELSESICYQIDTPWDSINGFKINSIGESAWIMSEILEEELCDNIGNLLSEYLEMELEEENNKKKRSR